MWLRRCSRSRSTASAAIPPRRARSIRFSIKQEIIENPIGKVPRNQKEPGRVEFPTIGVTILQRDAGPWMKWWDALVREGKHVLSQQHTGHIWFLPATRSAQVSFSASRCSHSICLA